MKDRMRKEYRKKGGRCPLERLEWPDWTPEWYKRKGEMWQWDLPENEELITAFQDRQEAKEPYGYRDPFADSDDESEMGTEMNETAVFQKCVQLCSELGFADYDGCRPLTKCVSSLFRHWICLQTCPSWRVVLCRI